jgi:hypothetical protein
VQLEAMLGDRGRHRQTLVAEADEADLERW